MRSRLDERVQVQRRENTVGADGGVTQTWVTEESRWADVRASKVDERTEANSVVALRTHTVTMRYYRDLSPEHRILYGDLALNIHAVVHDPDRRQRWTTAHCQEVV